MVIDASIATEISTGGGKEYVVTCVSGLVEINEEYGRWGIRVKRGISEGAMIVCNWGCVVMIGWMKGGITLPGQINYWMIGCEGVLIECVVSGSMRGGVFYSTWSEHFSFLCCRTPNQRRRRYHRAIAQQDRRNILALAPHLASISHSHADL